MRIVPEIPQLTILDDYLNGSEDITFLSEMDRVLFFSKDMAGTIADIYIEQFYWNFELTKYLIKMAHNSLRLRNFLNFCVGEKLF